MERRIDRIDRFSTSKFEGREAYYADENANVVYYQTKLLIISPANKVTQRLGIY